MFADVAVDEERVRQQWPSPGVPPGFTEAAQAMDTLHTFAPNVDGPANMRAASCQLPCADKGDNKIVADNDAEMLMLMPLLQRRLLLMTLLQRTASQATSLRSATNLVCPWTCRRNFS